MKKPILVLMAGLPGVGKTTLACKLGSILHWPVVDKDTIKDTLLEYSSRTGILHTDDHMVGSIAYDISFDLMREILLHQRKSMILDSSLHHQAIFNKAINLAYETDTQLKIILCSCDEEIRQERIRSRVTRPSQVYCQRVPKEIFFNIEQYIGGSSTEALKVCTDNNLASYTNRASAYVLGKDSGTITRLEIKLRSYLKQARFPLTSLANQTVQYRAPLNDAPLITF